MALGLLGRKLEMTQINDDAKGRIAVTLVQLGPCLIMQKKTIEKDGYVALKLAFGEKRAKNTTKALMGSFAKVKSTPKRFIREFRMTAEETSKFEEGQEITLDQLFTVGQLVDVRGHTKGRGFTGVFKRWGMKGNRRTHGAHEFYRHGGSIGTRTWPGWVHKGKHMPGHYGNEKVTTGNLRVERLIPEHNCLVLSGAVPGSTNGFIEVFPSMTRKPKKVA